MSLPSTSVAVIPIDRALGAAPSPDVIASVRVVEANPLFSQTNKTGRLKTPDQFKPSKNGPRLIAPSPKMQHEIFVSRLSLLACAAPVAIFMFAATTPLAPSIPTLASAMCIDPPFPLHIPPRLPNNSSIIASGSAPLARVCPWPLCVLSRKSSFIKFLQTPDAIASCPIDKWIAPRTSLS